MVPPQVNTVARKPLSKAFEELAAEKIVPIKATEVEDGESADSEAQDAAE